LAQYRVIWADLARRLEAVALTGNASHQLIPLNTCYVTTLPDAQGTLALAAWLNSRWIRVLGRLAADAARGGYRRYNAAVVGGLPMPPAVLRDNTLIAIAERAYRGEEVQSDIDHRVAELLDLDESERRELRSLG